MAITTVTVTGDFKTLIRTPIVGTVVAWVETNLPKGQAPVDLEHNQVLLGRGVIDLDANNTFSLDGLVAYDSVDVSPTGIQYRFHADYLPGGPWNAHREQWDSGWLSLPDAGGDLAALIGGAGGQYAPPTYATQLTQQLDDHAATLQAPMDAAVTSAQGSATAAAASAQQAHDISGISTSDGVVTALVNDSASTTKAALTATNALGPTFTSPTYDTAGNLTDWTQGGIPCSATYDTAGNLATLTVNSTTRTFTYDAEGNLEEIA